MPAPAPACQWDDDSPRIKAAVSSGDTPACRLSQNGRYTKPLFDSARSVHTSPPESRARSKTPSPIPVTVHASNKAGPENWTKEQLLQRVRDLEAELQDEQQGAKPAADGGHVQANEAQLRMSVLEMQNAMLRTDNVALHQRLDDLLKVPASNDEVWESLCCELHRGKQLVMKLQAKHAALEQDNAKLQASVLDLQTQLTVVEADQSTPTSAEHARQMCSQERFQALVGQLEASLEEVTVRGIDLQKALARLQASGTESGDLLDSGSDGRKQDSRLDSALDELYGDQQDDVVLTMDLDQMAAEVRSWRREGLFLKEVAIGLLEHMTWLEHERQSLMAGLTERGRAQRLEAAVVSPRAEVEMLKAQIGRLQEANASLALALSGLDHVSSAKGDQQAGADWTLAALLKQLKHKLHFSEQQQLCNKEELRMLEDSLEGLESQRLQLLAVITQNQERDAAVAVQTQHIAQLKRAIELLRTHNRQILAVISDEFEAGEGKASGHKTWQQQVLDLLESKSPTYNDTARDAIQSVLDISSVVEGLPKTAKVALTQLQAEHRVTVKLLTGEKQMLEKEVEVLQAQLDSTRGTIAALGGSHSAGEPLSAAVTQDLAISQSSGIDDTSAEGSGGPSPRERRQLDHFEAELAQLHRLQARSALAATHTTVSGTPAALVERGCSLVSSSRSHSSSIGLWEPATQVNTPAPEQKPGPAAHAGQSETLARVKERMAAWRRRQDGEGGAPVEERAKDASSKVSMWLATHAESASPRQWVRQRSLVP